MKAPSAHVGVVIYESGFLTFDRGVVEEAMNGTTHALLYVSDKLTGNRDFMMEAVQKDAEALRYASDKLKADRGTCVIVRVMLYVVS